MSKRKLKPGDITERIFLQGVNHLSSDVIDKLMDYVTSFCIDNEGRVRKSAGIIAAVGSDDLNFVPRVRFDINCSPWNAHDYYVEIELPNPAVDFAHYQRIREAFVSEIKKRLT